MADKLSQNHLTGLEIAVIGMAGRFPGARNLQEYWNNLEKGVESISFFLQRELEEAGVDPEMLAHPAYVKAEGYLEDAEYFDPAFFNYTPLEARAMDPQLRIYHECIWTALEDAGYNPETCGVPIGVYSGASPHPGWLIEMLQQLKSPSQQFDVFNLNSSSSFGTRISYNFNLKGPSFSLQTACSTSLVAIHLACQGLLNAECDIALAGGVAVDPGGKTGNLFQEGMINSPDGHCRPFDARARGTIRGEGVGVVVLKRLQEAILDGDNIYAVIKGSAVNNDGSRKIGYTAPSIDGQAEVIKAALKAAEVEPESISYIESHGTGTALGDPIEIAGLKLVFKGGKKASCAIGSVKSNIGHCDSAAGAAGFLKTVLALKHRLIPATLHFESANFEIDFENSPFYVNNEKKDWQSNGSPRRAGVSSFGIGGTNAHIILEEWVGPDVETHKPAAQSGPRLILLSARTQSALERMTVNLAEFFGNYPGVSLPDVAYTLQTGRKTFKYRAFTICESETEAVANLSSRETGRLQVQSSTENNRPVILMFPGQGSQYLNMGKGLYDSEPVFRETMDRCFRILEPLMDYNLKKILYSDFFPGLSAKTGGPDDPDINRTEITQPVLFAIEYALAKLLSTWGINPVAMTGHSIGEYTAACLSGVFSLEDALKLVALRGKLMQQMPPGDMLSVTLPEAELLPLLNDELSLAAVNGPDNCVVSGKKETVAEFDRQLSEKGCQTRLLFTSHAFHSAMMDPILDSFAEAAARIPLNKPRLPFISNVSGARISDAQAVDPGYWASHLRRTVRFYDGLTRLLAEEQNAVFVEVGPGRVLSTLLRQHPRKKPGHETLYLVRHPREEAADDRFLLEKIGRLWQKGVTVNREASQTGEKRLRLSLPTYPFERQSFAVKKDFKQSGADNSFDTAQKPVKQADITRWFYVPSWKGVQLPVRRKVRITGTGCWLVLTESSGFGAILAERLKEERQQVVTVNRGTAFKKVGENTFTVNPAREEDFTALFEYLSTQEIRPGQILHLWNVTGTDVASGLQPEEQYMDPGFYSLIYLARAMGLLKMKQPVSIVVISTRLQAVAAGDAVDPLKAVLLGPVRVIPLEYANISCRSIDIELLPENHGQVVEDLLFELSGQPDKPVVALRGRSRWEQDIEPLQMGNPEAELPPVKQQGVYLITGGLGGLGLVLAAGLAKRSRVKLVLLDKSEFPPAQEWSRRLADSRYDPGDPVIMKIERLRQIEKMGAEIIVCCADMTDLQQMRAVFRDVKDEFGAIDGVIHTAGLADGGLIQVRSRRQSEAVLAAKVTGTLVLDQLLAEEKLDFFVVCSSLNSLLPLPGQVAYCAANSFLDSFALQKAVTGQAVLAINWDTWQEVGMAAAAVEKAAAARPVAHPLLDMCIVENPGLVRYISRFSAKRSWVLDGHRIMGSATMPGTGYLEILAAAFRHHTGSSTFEIEEAYLLSPLVVPDDESKTVHITLEKGGGSYTFSVKSRAGGGESSWQEHARGRIAPLQERENERAPLDLQEIAARCNNPEPAAQAAGDSGRQEYLQVGPRWDNLIARHSGANQGLAEIELPAEFISDPDSFVLHPALMDTATAFLAAEYGAGEFYLPFLFKGLRVMGALPRKVFSYARVKQETRGDSSAGQFLAFHITVMDETGLPYVELEEFTMLKVSPAADRQQPVLAGITASQPQFEVERTDPLSGAGADPLKYGILPAEGVDVLFRLLTGAPPQVLVSTIDLKKRLHFYRRQMSDLESAAMEKDRIVQPAYPRPEISSEYLPPENATQQQLVEIWQQIIGIGRIGILDDFFELGGDSLKGLSVISEIHKTFQVEFSITDFFTTPTIQGLAASIDSGVENLYSPIIPVEKRRFYLLSSAQRRLFFLQQMRPQSVFYNIPGILMVEGSLEKSRLDSLEAAFRVLIRRQESLRTTFHLLDEQPVQQIHDPGSVEFAISYRSVETGEVDDAGDEEDRYRRIIEGFVRPFDLTRPPLMRLEVVKTGEGKHLWLFDIHHIVSDATGFAVLHRELFQIYRDVELPSLKIQYKDFSCWQNDLLKSETFKKQRDYWLQVFPGEIPKVNLPTDYPRAKVSRFEGEMFLFQLSREDSLAFSEVGNAAGATLFMNLLAVMNILLFKYTGSRDIVIGSTHIGRSNAELRDIIGMFVNLLALRNRPEPELRYSEFLKKVKETTLKAFENQDMQFEMLVEELHLKVDTTRNPLFDVCINVQNYEQPTVEVEDLTFSPAGYSYKNAKFDMLLWANQVGEEIHFMLEYSTELFKPETAREISGHLLEIIARVNQDKEVKLKDIDISVKVVNPVGQIPDMDFGF